MNFDSIISQMPEWIVASAPYLFLLLLASYLILGGILDYHWRRYGVGIVRLLSLRIAYIVTGIILFGVLAVALISL
jgi:hypothetical protein